MFEEGRECWKSVVSIRSLKSEEIHDFFFFILWLVSLVFLSFERLVTLRTMDSLIRKEAILLVHIEVVVVEIRLDAIGIVTALVLAAGKARAGIEEVEEIVLLVRGH